MEIIKLTTAPGEKPSGEDHIKDSISQNDLLFPFAYNLIKHIYCLTGLGGILSVLTFSYFLFYLENKIRGELRRLFSCY